MKIILPGNSTAHPFNVQYRMERVAKYINGGCWLDYGCADGGYTRALLCAGAGSVCGVDVARDRIQIARAKYPDLTFYISPDGLMPLPDCSFDGVFMNEVLEHVTDDEAALREVHRVLRPMGVLVLISPNRWFPFDGHTVEISKWTSKRPTPFIPWLPRPVTDRWVTARNYWPREIRWKILKNGFDIIEAGFIMPVFENYAWLPQPVVQLFRRHIHMTDRMPVIQRFGVSNLVVAQRTY